MAEGALDRLVHDLFGPLTVIRGVCATLARDEPRDERRAGLALIDAETVRLAAGLDGLARAASGPPDGPRPRGPVGLAALAASVVERHRPAAAERGATLVLRIRTTPPTVTAAADDLRRALDNLVQNALRHCAWRVRVTVGRRAGWGYVRVADDGPGVAPADRERIFRPGERGSVPRGPGRGLGLAIARDLAEAHGGRLTLDPVGAGAAFRLA
ncbi:MAG TPA: HAMP domain-containing sensor histidine kinase, partial [Miltoncostaeaceae bacterium]|nr:HAMP domain-containing sensor histidine kinase [Miltoncostaeaceae bacterium]